MEPHEIILAPSVEEHLVDLSARQRRVVLDGIKTYLTYEPLVETRNRKPLRPNSLAQWELRLGELRAYYRVSTGTDRRVEVVAVGIKRREQVWIGGEKVTL
jgi:mRNA-degrading endonuclease RelE of RelBE toxin-antitoxin system